MDYEVLEMQLLIEEEMCGHDNIEIIEFEIDLS